MSQASAKTTRPPAFQPTPNAPPQTAPTPPVLTIGISGPTSARKTILTRMLAEIFQDFYSSGRKPIPPTTIHGDDFFIRKERCSIVEFRCGEADGAFLERTMKRDGIGFYAVERDGVGYRVRGPDTDCWDALDVSVICARIQSVISLPSQASIGDQNRVDEHLAGEQDGNGNREMIQVGSEHVRLKRKIGDEECGEIVEKYREHLKAWEGEMRRVVFVEGFLLFSVPPPASERASDKSVENINKNGDELVESDEKRPNGNGKGLEGKHITTLPDKALLQSHLQVKLLLLTPKSAVKSRWFSRKCYMDDELGGERRAGQLWKTEGYFEHVAWPNLEVKERAWLFGRDLEGKWGLKSV